MAVGYIPDIGQVVWLTLDPTQGHEQQARRPFLILTPQRYNDKTSLAVGCPITNETKGYPFEVPILGANNVTGFVLADHVKRVDWRVRRAEYKDTVDPRTVVSVLSLIKKLLGIQ